MSPRQSPGGIECEDIGTTFARMILALNEQGCPMYALELAASALDERTLRELAADGRGLFEPAGIAESIEHLADAVEADRRGEDQRPALARAIAAAREGLA